jgi:hypothetical protein
MTTAMFKSLSTWFSSFIHQEVNFCFLTPSPWVTLGTNFCHCYTREFTKIHNQAPPSRGVIPFIACLDPLWISCKHALAKLLNNERAYEMERSWPDWGCARSFKLQQKQQLSGKTWLSIGNIRTACLSELSNFQPAKWD